jgi:hypothetical protein
MRTLRWMLLPAWIGWCATHAGMPPQPYEQLAAVYRKAGRDEDARRISIAKQRARRRTIALPSRLWNLLLDILVGYATAPGWPDCGCWPGGLWARWCSPSPTPIT